MVRLAARLVAGIGCLAAVAIFGGCASGSAAGLRAAGQPQPPALGATFVGSVDTMKLSRDKAASLSSAEINRVVDLLASSMNVTHVTVDAPLERPSVIQAWANRIHAD